MGKHEQTEGCGETWRVLGAMGMWRDMRAYRDVRGHGGTWGRQGACGHVGIRDAQVDVGGMESVGMGKDKGDSGRCGGTWEIWRVTAGMGGEWDMRKYGGVVRTGGDWGPQGGVGGQRQHGGI